MKNLVLDLDQTLISTEHFKEEWLKRPPPRGTKRYVIPGTFVVVTRPHLREFLDYVFANFRVSVWTAASKSYGLWILRHVFPRVHRLKLRYFFFSYHTLASERRRGGHKDLSLLWETYGLPEFSRKNTVIVDDNDEVCRVNAPNTCINVTPWYFDREDSADDKELLRVANRLRRWAES